MKESKVIDAHIPSVRRTWHSGERADSEPLLRLTLDYSVREAIKKLESSFRSRGYDVARRILLSELVKERLDVTGETTEALFLMDPILVCQAILAEGSACLLFPVLVVARWTGGATAVVICSAWKEVGPDPISRSLAEQAQARLVRAAEQVTSSL